MFFRFSRIFSKKWTFKKIKKFSQKKYNIFFREITKAFNLYYIQLKIIIPNQTNFI